MNMIKKLFACFALVVFSFDAFADTTFQLTWTGQGGSSASASGYVTLNDTSMLTTARTTSYNAYTNNNIVAYSITVTGATSGNGTFTLANVGSAPIWTKFALNLSQNLIGQTDGVYTFGQSNSGDFNIFAGGSCSANAPGGLIYFTLKTDCFNGDTLLLTSILAGNLGPSASDTLASMNPNAYALRGAYIQQSAIINNGLNYDCTTFDEKGICVSAGDRVTDANNPSTNSQGALLIASYRANDNWRIGGYLDQNLSSNDPRGVNLDNNNPMGGVFAVWNQNTDGTGYQVRVAAGYSDKDVSISRTVIGTAEAGRGDSSLQSQAYSATLSRGFQLNDTRWIASPYVGVRYTKIKRASYTEDTSSDVTTPLSYSRLSQETTTALAGVRFNGQLAERVNVMASAGVESDIAHNTGDYAATGVDGLTPIAFNQNIRHVRPVAQAGVSYAIDKRQVVSANLIYRQEAFNSSNSTTGMVTYQVGF